MKNGKLIIIFSSVILVCAAISLLLFTKAPSSRVAGIFSDGELLYEIELDAVTEDYELVIEGEAGKNTVSVSKNGICVSSADCPDGVCVAHGMLGSGTPIVCLPNRLVIKWLGSSGYDAVTGV